ncbi:MAG: hypothetical protein IKJ99_03015 [Oscillospiraceae bacterium]|nr:hypothetical protein [Oscillospiraceae bacterium]
MEQDWSLNGDYLSTHDNLLDGFTFDDVILALHHTSKINEQTATAVFKDILEQRLTDMKFLFETNIDIIIAKAKEGRHDY